MQSHDLGHLTERSGAGHFFNKIPCGSSSGKTNAGKNKTDYSALRKPRGQKPCLGKTRLQQQLHGSFIVKNTLSFCETSKLDSPASLQVFHIK